MGRYVKSVLGGKLSRNIWTLARPWELFLELVQENTALTLESLHIGIKARVLWD